MTKFKVQVAPCTMTTNQLFQYEDKKLHHEKQCISKNLQFVDCSSDAALLVDYDWKNKTWQLQNTDKCIETVKGEASIRRRNDECKSSLQKWESPLDPLKRNSNIMHIKYWCQHTNEHMQK